MAQFRFPFLVTLLALTSIHASGCNQQANAPEPVSVVPQDVTAKLETGEIELFDAKVSLVQPNMAQFEVSYRFIKGRPNKYYLCNVSFPGTANVGKKTLMNWELKDEGVIRDRLQLRQKGAKSFEIFMAETTSPQAGYKKISNVAAGPVE
jgi:hypothetical protein